MTEHPPETDHGFLLRKLRQYEMAESLGDVGHWFWTLGDPTVEWSPQTFRIHRLPTEPQNITLERAIAFYHPDDREMVSENLQRAIDTRAGFGMEARLLLDGDVTVHVRCEGATEVDSRGEVKSVFGVIQDVSERHAVESKMRAMQRRQQDFIDISTDWVWEMGPDLRFTYMSAQVEIVTGVPPEFHIGKTRRELMGTGDISPDMETHLAVLDQHKPFWDFRFWREGPDGILQYLSTSGMPFYDEDGNFAGYRGVGRDLTAFQRAEEELLTANRDLNMANKAKSDAMGRLSEANAQLESQNAEMQQVQRELEHNALHDPLTGLANRRFLDITLDHMAEHCRITGSWLGALHIDLDRFKQINDTLGHAAGDAVLTHVAQVLSTSVPAGDFVARVGGDEFVVISSGHGGEEMLGSLAARLIAEFSRPLNFKGRDCWFGASVGIATMKGQEIQARQLLVNADVALYRAKRDGRGCFTFYTNALQQELIDYKAIADGILLGLDHEEFVPWYQPQLCAKTLELTGVEALARWEPPKGRARLPVEFLEIAEDLSAVAAIDRIILEKSVAAVAHWHETGFSVPRLSVNVSAKRLMDDKLLESLAEMKLPPGLVSFELLESVFLDEVDTNISWNIDALKEMGIEVELDDFGSGHASLISLVNLGPDAIKIDRQLIAAMTLDDARLNLVRSIVDICRSLNVRVVAEGVETAEEVRLLTEMRCDVLQGFFFAKPMPKNAFEQFLQSWSPAEFAAANRLTDHLKIA